MGAGQPGSCALGSPESSKVNSNRMESTIFHQTTETVVLNRLLSIPASSIEGRQNETWNEHSLSLHHRQPRTSFWQKICSIWRVWTKTRHAALLALTLSELSINALRCWLASKILAIWNLSLSSWASIEYSCLRRKKANKTGAQVQ